MPAQTTPAFDKATEKLVAQTEESIRGIKSITEDFRDPKELAVLQRELKELKARFEVAKAQPIPKATAAIKSAHKEAAALLASATKRRDAVYSLVRRREAQGEVNALLMQALLVIGKVQEPALAKKLMDDQNVLRRKRDTLEGMKDDWKAFVALLELRESLEAFMVGAKEAQTVGAWVRGTYLPAAGRAATAAKTVADERCKRALVAEIAEIDAAKNKAIAAMDVAAAKATTLAGLQAIERMVARVRATGPAIDREFERLDVLIRKAGKATTHGETLRSLRLHKTGGWPKSGTVAEMDREIGAFEKALARFAAMVEKDAAAAPKTSKA
jgi:hypothetical protein